LRIPSRTETPIAYKLLLLILVSSSLVTLLITSIQLVFDYQADIGEINSRLHDIKISYMESIAQSVWNFNKKQYDIQLRGILNLKDVVYTEIRDPNGKIIAFQGKNTSSQIIKKTFVLQTTDFGKSVSPGVLVVVASLARVYRHLLHKTLLILISQGIKTLLISSVIILAFYTLVTKHLWKISEFTKTFDLNSNDYLALNKLTGDSPDELDLVVNALNEMKTNLSKQQKQINDLNKDLEIKVTERTAELEKSNQLLVKKNLELNNKESLLLKQQEELVLLATHDPLTSLYNRRKLQQDLEKLWRVAYREHSLLAVAMLDIDHFKTYNDHYGHTLGDQALVKIARACSKSLLRPFDCIYRYGGEEFIILLPQIDMTGARYVISRIFQSLERLRLPHEYSATADHITVSIGCVLGIPSESNSIDTFINRSDQLLYKAKSAGRNQAAWASI